MLPLKRNDALCILLIFMWIIGCASGMGRLEADADTIIPDNESIRELAPPAVNEVAIPAEEAPAAETAALTENRPQELPERNRWEKHGITEEYGQGYTKILVKEMLSDKGFKYSYLENPSRMILDVMEPRNDPSIDRLPLQGDAFSRLRTGRYPDKARLVFDYRSDDIPQPRVDARDGELIIVASNSLEPIKANPPMGGPEVPPEGWKPAQVQGIDFTQTDNSSDVIIGLDSKVPYNVEKKDDQIILVLPGTVIPKHLLRPIDTQAFPSAIQTITPGQAGEGPDGQARIAVSLREVRPYNVVEDRQGIRLSVQLPERISASSTPLLPAPDIGQAEGQVVARGSVPAEAPATPSEPEREIKLKAPAGRPAGAPTVLDPGATLKTNSYKGRRISLDFKDADIQNILRLIAEVSGKNIVISEEVTGKVTIRLLNVPWDQALDVIMKTYALDKEELAPNILRVAPYTQLEKERASAHNAVMAKEKVEALKMEVIPVNYAKAQSMLGVISSLKSKRSDAGILLDSRTNTIILRDLPDNVEQMSKLITHLDTPTPQVLIEAKVVELDVNHEREIGIQWGSLYSVGPATGNPTGLNFPNRAAIGGAQAAVPGVSNPIVNLPAAVDDAAGGAIGLSVASLTNSLSLDMQLSALEQNNHARVLSSPRVATLNNQEARIEQGREIPYVTTSDEGTKTEFKEAKLKLSVTPQINFDRSIIMNIVVTNDTPITDPIVGYIIGKKEAKTTVLVRDGETAVIGGIYTSNDGKSEGGVPVFKDIPGLGTLFRKKGKNAARTELVIFITPRIIPLSQVNPQAWIKDNN